MSSFESSKFPELSVIFPIYNEEKLARVIFSIDRNSRWNWRKLWDYLYWCGSQDNNLERAVEFCERDSRIKVIDLSRNFGKEIVLSAGIEYALGNAVIPIDSDLQDPPELIIEWVSKWQEGFDVVYATRLSRQGESCWSVQLLAIFIV